MTLFVERNAFWFKLLQGMKSLQAKIIASHHSAARNAITIGRVIAQWTGISLSSDWLITGQRRIRRKNDGKKNEDKFHRERLKDLRILPVSRSQQVEQSGHCQAIQRSCRKELMPITREKKRASPNRCWLSTGIGSPRQSASHFGQLSRRSKLMGVFSFGLVMITTRNHRCTRRWLLSRK